MIDWLIQIDTSLFYFFNVTIANGLFDFIFPIITNRENHLIALGVVAIVYVGARRKEAMVGISLAVVTVAFSDQLCCTILKPLVGRLRPCHPEHFLEGGRYLVGMKHSLSFPSAHSMNWFAQATLFTFLYPKQWPWFFAVATPIAFSRVYVGVHYPIDVTVGAVLGAGVGAAVYGGYRLVRRKVTITNFPRKNMAHNR
ncbi:MAG: phosphatase PAP2 family protein [Chitinivibrionales bacterium]|nr:phosphatase PAP2 family protein [Chitinivibrionales bacterium]MBD3355551.1 phosphatase PAP2 family protein [Chitinivibrionales bacterium]